ncbi:hypothetical protein Y1Q_0014591 [Alligator mississippiensis]|uniref:Uncharacterized protein n=1 Tax=Alligator mississippiensis TaxID=8496 RepID=A0A151NWH2_ALLMI|nr:hypothetical protein Y1Q_0014591 [Alligator mississippiensis]
MDPSLFEVPRGYSVVGSHPDTAREDDDDLLQFAIQQSLLEAGSEYDQVGAVPCRAVPRCAPTPRREGPFGRQRRGQQGVNALLHAHHCRSPSGKR